jgi:hypothetical protein
MAVAAAEPSLSLPHHGKTMETTQGDLSITDPGTALCSSS